MNGNASNQDPNPVLLPGSRDWHPGDELSLRLVDLRVFPTLGQVGPVVEVQGPNGFARTILRIPVEPSALTGIDETSIRVFQVAADGAVGAVVAQSAFATGLGYVWASIQQPGRYVAVGLPRDRMIRGLLGDLAAARATAGPEPARAIPLRQRVIAPLRAMSLDDLYQLRAAVAADDVATGADPKAAMEARRGRAGRIQPPDLPGGRSTAEVVAQMETMAASADALAEERLLTGGFASLDPAISPLIARAEPGPPADADVGGLRFPRAPGIPESANWWTYHHDPQHTGVVTDSHITQANVANLRLRYRLPLDGPVVSVPAVIDNTVYVGVGNSRRAFQQRGGTLYAIDLLSGTVRTSFTFNTPWLGGSRQGMAGIACTPAAIGGRVYVSGLDGCLYCLDAITLAPIWVTNLRRADPLHNQPVTHAVAAEGWSSPMVVNGCVYVGFGESESNTFGFVYCVDALTGVVRWLFCTTLFPGMAENEPNLVPRSVAGLFPMPLPYRVAPDPPFRGGSPWSSVGYDPVSQRIVVGTGNVLPQGPVPQPKYSLGVLSLDAATGRNPRFFQPTNADNYRPDDSDCDVPPGPLLYMVPGAGGGWRRLVAIGSKNGSFFVLDADTLVPVAKRQLLPRTGGNGGFPGDTGQPIPAVDPHPPDPEGGPRTENFYGIFSTAAVSYAQKRLFVGVGGFAFGIGTPGIDTATTAFMRALDWENLTDHWPMQTGQDQVSRYIVSRPPMYTTPGEAGFSSPVLVNDLVFLSTSRPGLHAFATENGLAVWSASGFGPPMPNSFTLGPVVFGDFVIVGTANLGLLVYSL
jgi:outer membrane protein assembly factor BamB